MLKPEDRLTSSETLFAFAGWLTCRKEVTRLGGSEDCGPVVEMIKVFCAAHDLPPPEEGWDKKIVSIGTVGTKRNWKRD